MDIFSLARKQEVKSCQLPFIHKENVIFSPPFACSFLKAQSTYLLFADSLVLTERRQVEEKKHELIKEKKKMGRKDAPSGIGKGSVMSQDLNGLLFLLLLLLLLVHIRNSGWWTTTFYSCTWKFPIGFLSPTESAAMVQIFSSSPLLQILI